MELVIGFVLGVVASVIAWVLTERAASPRLEIVPDHSRFQGQTSGNPPHEFFHVRVRNISARWPVPGRRPAWASTATIRVLRDDGTRMISDDILARWTSQPEPLLPVVAQGQPGNVLDPARLIQARRMDVHGHQDELIAVCVKFEGEADCHIFTNESYIFPKWQNPQWRLPVGRHRLRITVLYERGSVQEDFELTNAGSSRNDVRLVPWSQSRSAV